MKQQKEVKMTTLKDYLRDMIIQWEKWEIHNEESMDELINEYLDIITKRLIGKEV